MADNSNETSNINEKPFRVLPRGLTLAALTLTRISLGFLIIGGGRSTRDRQLSSPEVGRPMFSSLQLRERGGIFNVLERCFTAIITG